MYWHVIKQHRVDVIKFEIWRIAGLEASWFGIKTLTICIEICIKITSL
jgi:hypothetical protein